MGRDVFESNDGDYDDDDCGECDVGDGTHFTLQFGTETAVVRHRRGMTLRDAFASKADVLGFDFSRNLTYRDHRGRVLSGEDHAEPDRVYVASVQHETKGN